MGYILDAQVVHGICCLDCGRPCLLIDEPADLLGRLAPVGGAVIDLEGKLEHEWRETVEPEWLEGWLARELSLDRIKVLPLHRATELLAQLRKHKFPTTSRDRWYIQLAVSSRKSGNHAWIISEDLDFYDPSAKRLKLSRDKRDAIVNGSGSPVQRVLRKNGIETGGVRRTVQQIP